MPAAAHEDKLAGGVWVMSGEGDKKEVKEETFNSRQAIPLVWSRQLWLSLQQGHKVVYGDHQAASESLGAGAGRALRLCAEDAHLSQKITGTNRCKQALFGSIH